MHFESASHTHTHFSALNTAMLNHDGQRPRDLEWTPMILHAISPTHLHAISPTHFSVSAKTPSRDVSTAADKGVRHWALPWATQPKRTKARVGIDIISCDLTHLCLGDNTKQRCVQCCDQRCAFTEKNASVALGLALGDAAETDKDLEI